MVVQKAITLLNFEKVKGSSILVPLPEFLSLNAASEAPSAATSPVTLFSGDSHAPTVTASHVHSDRQ
jgi:hypothetical protein